MEITRINTIQEVPAGKLHISHLLITFCCWPLGLASVREAPLLDKTALKNPIRYKKLYAVQMTQLSILPLLLARGKDPAGPRAVMLQDDPAHSSRATLFAMGSYNLDSGSREKKVWRELTR